jgi:hypothetical protein
MDIGEKAAEVMIGRMKEARSPFTKFKEKKNGFGFLGGKELVMNPQTHWLFICAASTHVSRRTNLTKCVLVVVFRWKYNTTSSPY